MTVMNQLLFSKLKNVSGSTSQAWVDWVDNHGSLNCYAAIQFCSKSCDEI